MCGFSFEYRCDDDGALSGRFVLLFFDALPNFYKLDLYIIELLIFTDSLTVLSMLHSYHGVLSHMCCVCCVCWNSMASVPHTGASVDKSRAS